VRFNCTCHIISRHGVADILVHDSARASQSGCDVAACALTSTVAAIALCAHQTIATRHVPHRLCIRKTRAALRRIDLAAR